MANRKLVRVLNHILTTASDDRGVSDAELLQRFTDNGDAAAFELLVFCYQRLVFGICRRILHDVHDAEDAFQATFLILARKANSVTRRASLGSWLHQVATHAALAVRARQSRQAMRTRSLDGVDAVASEDVSHLERQELWSVVDEEVNRLPARLQAAVVLCYFEGKTIAEASQILRCPQGTVASRLARAKERLRLRLTERGMVFSSGVLAAGLSQTGLAGAAAEGLVRRTGQAIAALASRAATEAVSGKVIALSKEVLRTMFIRKLTTGVAAILVAGMIVLGGSMVLRLYPRATAEQPANPLLKNHEDRAVPVTVGRAVQREVAPFEVFNGRLTKWPWHQRRCVVFAMDERSYLRYERLRMAGKVKGPGASMIANDLDKLLKGAGDPLAVSLSDETDFPHKGWLYDFGEFLDETTGTITVRAMIAEEPSPLLVIGMSARVRMSFGPPRSVLEVPEEAVGREQGQTFLWVVSDRNNVERRSVRTGPMDGGMRIIEEGLKPEERIVIGGAKGLKPGDHVEP